MKKIAAIVQARVFSTRLPRKVLRDLPYGSNITVLEQVIRRLKRSGKLDAIIVATTPRKDDDRIVKLADKERVKWHRGSENDVLARYYGAAREYGIDVIVRVTSDCPCVDPAVVDLMIARHLKTGANYTTNAMQRTFPHGAEVDVFGFDALETAHKNAGRRNEREHVVPYMYAHPALFKMCRVRAPGKLRGPDIRITLDTEEDYALLCAVYDELYRKNRYFGVRDIVGLFNRKPWLKLINRKAAEKKRFPTLKAEVREAVRILKLQELSRARGLLERRALR